MQLVERVVRLMIGQRVAPGFALVAQQTGLRFEDFGARAADQIGREVGRGARRVDVDFQVLVQIGQLDERLVTVDQRTFVRPFPCVPCIREGVESKNVSTRFLA